MRLFLFGRDPRVKHEDDVIERWRAWIYLKGGTMDKKQELNFYTGCSVGVHHELSCDYYVPYLDYVMFLCLQQATNAQKLKTVLYFHRLLKNKSPVPPSLIDLSPEFKKRILARCSKQNKMYPPYVPEFGLITE